MLFGSAVFDLRAEMLPLEADGWLMLRGSELAKSNFLPAAKLVMEPMTAWLPDVNTIRSPSWSFATLTAGSMVACAPLGLMAAGSGGLLNAPRFTVGSTYARVMESGVTPITPGGLGLPGT